MAKTQFGICALTGEKCELQESHIYPKFVYKHLKQTGGGRFRVANNPNQALQDGLKKHLLGSWAELEFSKREKWFAENIFSPFINGQLANTKLVYTEDLYYFCISLLWRVLLLTKDNVIGKEERRKCDEALEEWRSFLNGGSLPNTYGNIYMMPITPELFDKEQLIQPGTRENVEVQWYIRRLFDSDLFGLIPNNNTFFCKIPYFFFWAAIERDNQQMNYGLRISPNGGKIDFKRYHIGNGYVKEYVFLRILLAAQKADEVSENMSKEQQDKILQFTLQDKHLRNSELADLLIQMGLAQ